MAATQDHEQVSQYPLDATQLEQLLTNASECVLMWATKDGWPVGVIHSMLWKHGRFWLTVAAHRHRSAALRRDPRCSVSVSGTAAPVGSAPAGAATAKGRLALSPVPGGVGPMTVAMLLRNTVESACRRQ